MDPACWKLIGIAITIVAALAAVVVALWKSNVNLHGEMLKESSNSKQVLRELYERMLERMKK